MATTSRLRAVISDSVRACGHQACHFVHDYSMKTASLATRKLLDPTNHCAQYIVNTLQDILHSWKVLNKAVCVVTDNAHSMLKASEILKIRNLPCFAHTLHLVVQDGLKLNQNVKPL